MVYGALKVVSSASNVNCGLPPVQIVVAAKPLVILLGSGFMVTVVTDEFEGRQLPLCTTALNCVVVVKTPEV